MDMGVGRGDNNSSQTKSNLFRNVTHRALESAGSCEHGNEPSGSVKGMEFLD